MHKRILIIQFREGYVQTNEQLVFKHRFKNHTEDITFENGLDSSVQFPAPRSLDGVILAGSGDNSLTLHQDWYANVESYIKNVMESDIPLLGICFGHQFIARTLGATIKRVESQKELGTVSITLNDEGMIDPLFNGLGRSFYSIAGHNDSVIQLPHNCTLLASTKHCPIQAYRVAGSKIYGVQFHPELDEKDFRARVEYYRDYYINAGSDFNDILTQARQETNDQRILQNFYAIVSGSTS